MGTIKWKITKVSYIEFQEYIWEAFEDSWEGPFMTSFIIYYELIWLKCESAENLLVEALHIEFQQNLSMVHWTHRKNWTVLSLLWKGASDNGNFPTTILIVCNAKYVFKSQEWRSPKATDWTIWPSNSDKNKKFVSVAKWGKISLQFQWVQGGLSHR